MRGRGVAAAIVAAVLVFPTAAAAQQVTGLTAEQEYGFTTLKWDAVPDATSYEIERTPVDAANQPTGEAEIVGRWFPDRTITPATRYPATPGCPDAAVVSAGPIFPLSACRSRCSKLPCTINRCARARQR